VNITILLQKLIDIERSIGVEPDKIILGKVFDAESCVLSMQKEMMNRPRSEPWREAWVEGFSRWRAE
jgi:hypothetical protein